eukprot:CAMPEP_0119031480 /NCGR_PEP_ID=MMETSP1176-20130426/41564_1 /TAXON_ID=265551 /ORGANISM="Synedropsis recta cf, Strain CCMP1620" /LENGTH=104 /DNA_ID=CAMNT_0006987875 /DNA_START=15 /DNA_END=329 /DNA_ORIENTATION=+
MTDEAEIAPVINPSVAVAVLEQGSGGGGGSEEVTTSTRTISKKKTLPKWKQKPIYNYNENDEPELTHEQKIRISFWFFASLASIVGTLACIWWLFYWQVDKNTG